MRIAILHGSPKGENSITAQYVRYLEKLHPEHAFELLPVAHDIAALEKKPAAFQGVMAAVERADAIIWSFPVYYLLVPGQLKRFVELVAERNAQGAFAGKYATAISSSAKFYDHLAHHYLQGVCEDWDVRYVDGYSAEMEDLFQPRERERLCAFFRSFASIVDEGRPVARRFPRVTPNALPFTAGDPWQVPKSVVGRVALVTDAREQDASLREMIRVFVAACPCPVDVVNLWDEDIRHGCLGCCRCCVTDHCASKDGTETMWQEKIFTADAVVLAGSIVDRHFSARWKSACDRSFYDGHRPRRTIKAVGCLVSGPLRQLPELREWYEGMAQTKMRLGSLPMVSDEDDPATTTANIVEMARQVGEDVATSWPRPMNFLGVAGHLLFRDLVYMHSGVFRGDTRFYKREGLLDYPHGNFRRRAFNALLSIALSIPMVRAEFVKRIKTDMAQRHRKIVADAVAPPHTRGA